ITFDSGNNYQGTAKIIAGADSIPATFFSSILNAKYHTTADILSVRMGH
ncbi:MAG: hypothetical protein F6K17_43185, partial [Okeania sp. SIO3C4]|nr:hypothetical protein [Okeania sp. SIO3C4]